MTGTPCQGHGGVPSTPYTARSTGPPCQRNEAGGQEQSHCTPATGWVPREVPQRPAGLETTTRLFLQGLESVGETIYKSME